MWRFVAPEFERDFRVILFDHVGAGNSDLSAYNVSKYSRLDGYADDLLEIIHALNLRDVVFVGHSVSSMIGAIASIRQPEVFSHLVMIGPSPCYINGAGYVGGFEREDIDSLLASLDSNYLGWSSVAAPMIMGNADRPELSRELENSFCRTDPQIAKRFARVTFLSDNRADLSRITCPTLILQCSSDAIAPIEVGHYVHREIEGSTLAVMKATGHCPNLSAPEETAALIRSYLADTARHAR